MHVDDTPATCSDGLMELCDRADRDCMAAKELEDKFNDETAQGLSDLHTGQAASYFIPHPA